MHHSLTARFAPVARPRITERLLSAAAYPVTLVIAPAGYGKTTALKDRLAQGDLRSILVPTPHGANLDLFIQCFAKALSALFPEMGTPPNEKNAGTLDSQTVIELYVAWASTHLRDASCTIAVDDLHNADNDKSVATFLMRLVDISTNRLKWIFSSRTHGNLPLTRWQAYGFADAAITAADLRMSLDEAVYFATSVNSPATTEQIAEWVTLTQGFPVPLAYAIRLSASRGTVDDIIDGTRAITFSFLAEQLWASLSEDERELLEVASFLPPTHMHQYEDVGLPHATTTISDLCKRIAFLALTPAGIFSMHDLFREFLQQQLSASGPAKQRSQLRTATNLLLKFCQYDNAFSLLVKFSSSQEIADTIEQFPSATIDLMVVRGIVEATELLKPEDIGVRLLELHVEHSYWFGDPIKSYRYSQELIRRPTVSSAQILCTIRSTLRALNFQDRSAHKEWLASAPQIFSCLAESDLVQARSYEASIRSRYPETQDEARSIAQEVRSQLSRLSPRAQIDTLMGIGTAYFYLRELDTALSVTREAAILAESSAGAGERARAQNHYGLMLANSRDPEVESLFRPLRDLVERTGSWRFAHTSHWFPAQYYALQANLQEFDEALAWQSRTIASDESEKRRLSSMRRLCLNLYRVLREDYVAVTLDHASSDLPKQLDFEYDFLACVAVAYGFMSNTLECEQILTRLKQIRRALSPLYLDGAVEAIQSEIIAICTIGRWAQARQLHEQSRGKFPYFSKLEGALTLLCQGPPFLNVLAAVEPCLNKPYVGYTALLIKRTVEHDFVDRRKQALTPAEMEVLRMITLGKSNKEIANTRARSEETIKRQVASLFRKLGVENRTSAVAAARERGILN